MIRSLQSLRGIFSFFIFLHHLALFEPGGDCGVSFFFILSGFVLARRYCGEVCAVNLKGLATAFMKGRLRKMWPLQIVCMAAAAAVYHYGLTKLNLLTNFLDALFLQAWIPLPDFFLSGNSVAWFLSDIMFFYLLLFPLLLLMNRLGARGRACAVTALLAVYSAAIQFVPDSLMQGLIYISPLFRLVDFILGIFLWYLYRSLRQPLFPSGTAPRLTLVELSVVAVVAVSAIAWWHIPLRYNQAMMWYLPSMLAVFTFTAVDSAGGLLTRLLHTRPLLWFGSISFEFYMVHGFTIHWWQSALPGCPLWATAAGSFCLSLALAIAASKFVRFFAKRSPENS